MNLTLRIKKIYFDLIASGDKTIEYRSDSLFYKTRLTNKVYKTITFHYQKTPRLKCDVVKIVKIKNPEIYPFLTTPYLFAIYLKNPKLYFKAINSKE